MIFRVAYILFTMGLLTLVIFLVDGLPAYGLPFMWENLSPRNSKFIPHEHQLTKYAIFDSVPPGLASALLTMLAGVIISPLVKIRRGIRATREPARNSGAPGLSSPIASALHRACRERHAQSPLSQKALSGPFTPWWTAWGHAPDCQASTSMIGTFLVSSASYFPSCSSLCSLEGRKTS